MSRAFPVPQQNEWMRAGEGEHQHRSIYLCMVVWCVVSWRALASSALGHRQIRDKKTRKRLHLSRMGAGLLSPRFIVQYVMGECGLRIP